MISPARLRNPTRRDSLGSDKILPLVIVLGIQGGSARSKEVLPQARWTRLEHPDPRK